MKHSTQKIQSLILTLPSYKGQYVGFFHSGVNPIVRGWWERKDGSEGGELVIDTREGEVSDFDGAFDLPNYVRKELATLDIAVDP